MLQQPNTPEVVRGMDISKAGKVCKCLSLVSMKPQLPSKRLVSVHGKFSEPLKRDIYSTNFRLAEQEKKKKRDMQFTFIIIINLLP